MINAFSICITLKGLKIDTGNNYYSLGGGYPNELAENEGGY